MSEDHEEDRGFTVKDRRRFSDTGEAKAEGEVPRAEEPRASDPASEPGGQAPRRDAEAGEDPALPEITLSTFVMSLSTQVLLHMGEIPGAAGEQAQRDMTAAKQVIDILGLLRDKTRGNLDANEEALFDNVLYDLRMRYVELSRR
jgi:hypothetical protein